MTTDKLKLANRLINRIEDLKSFLHYYEDNEYEITINLKNTRDTSFHTETFYIKDDRVLLDLIRKHLSEKLSEMQKTFNEL